FEDVGLVVDVAPTYQIPRCADCGHKVRSVYDRRERRWRHLDLGGIKVELRYPIRRVRCSRCGVLVEAVPWAEPGSGFTLAFERHVAYLAQRSDQTAVTEQMRVTWRTVGRIIRRVVRRHHARMGDRLDGLRIIGIDELSYRRHHEYVTIVVDHERAEVVWASEGKSAETLRGFFDLLGPERCSKLEVVTIDMSAAYIKAVTDAAPHARLVFDRFHVQRLAHDALDEVRRDEVRRVNSTDKVALKRTRWALQKNPWNLNNFEQDKVAMVQRTNQRLYRAYLLKETLLAVLDRRQINVASTKLDEWLAWAQRSKLKPFVKLARTIRKYRTGILAYVQTRFNNGRVEGLNGKARTLTRRAYGFHSAASLIAMLFLCCGGIHLPPTQICPLEVH
ncbi:MAG: ISL3 family transposase, partial [Myxococcota bacterium]